MAAEDNPRRTCAAGVRKGTEGGCPFYAGRTHDWLFTAANSLKQLADRLPAIDCGDRPAGVVEESRLGVDPEDVVNGLVDVGGRQGPVLGALAEAVGRADDAAALDAPAAQEAEHRIAPVVAAGRAHAPRCAAVAAVVHARRA